MENINYKRKWILSGLLWGVFMFIVLAIAMPLDTVPIKCNTVMKPLIITLYACSIFMFSWHEDEQPCTNTRNPDCPNYDPCIDTKQADASFRIFDSIPGFDCNDGSGKINLVYDVDTIWAGRTLNLIKIN